MNDLNRFTYNTMGSAAQHANYGAGGANWTTLAGQNSARMAGQATATIGGRTVVLTAASRIPLPAIVNAARGVALMNPTTAAVTLLGFAAMQGWLSPSGLDWNRDPETNLTHPFVKNEERECTGGFCTQYGHPSSGGTVWVWTKQAACEGFRVYVAGQFPAYTAQLTSCYPADDPFARVRVFPPGDPSSYFTQNHGLQTRQAPSEMSLIPYTWEAAEPLLSDAATHNYNAVDWKAITQGLLQRGGSIEPSQITTTVTGPASQPGEKTTTTGKNAAGEPTTTTKQTTHNYTYNNNTVTHNTTTVTTTINNITNQVENETTEQTENTPPEEDAPDLCEKNPEALACQKMGEAPDPEQLSKDTKDVTFEAVPFASSAACPSPYSLSFTVAGRSFAQQISYDGICNAATAWIRPFVLLAAALFAAYVFVGGLKA